MSTATKRYANKPYWMRNWVNASFGERRPTWEEARAYVGVKERSGLVGNAHYVEGRAAEYNFVPGEGWGIGSYRHAD